MTIFLLQHLAETVTRFVTMVRLEDERGRCADNSSQEPVGKLTGLIIARVWVVGKGSEEARFGAPAESGSKAEDGIIEPSTQVH